jgi:regulator of CtrA degradation
MTGENERKRGDGAAPPLHFRGNYEEAFDLLVEARNYVENHVPAFRYSQDPPDRVAMTTETMRLTSRLTQVMAWLMAQRAVQQGEIPEDEFVEDKYRLEAHDVCLKRAIEEMEDLPAGLCDLMERSYELYSRIMRLDMQYIDPDRKN